MGPQYHNVSLMTSDISKLIQENVALSNFSNFRLGGPARWFAEPKTEADAIALIHYAATQHWPIALLGNGANVLISDRGFSGLVIHMCNDDITVNGQTISAGAGVTIRTLLSTAARAGLGDPSLFRWLAGVPGSIGGSIYGNAGGRTQFLGDMIDSVTVITETGERKELTPQECEFGYRTSRFKRTKEIILRAKFVLPTNDKGTLLASIKDAALNKNTIQPTTAASTGCIFKNITVSDPTALSAELQPFVVEGQFPAWRAIVTAGCQGKIMGGAQVSPLHANYIVNTGTATAEQVVMLISFVKQQVRDQLGLQLHEEVQYLGF